ncbi:hypothetical protein PIB30_084241 [Stylosanthes scabra]|uniref:Uncharacterized protein n=1 Tax=Stylosanthes scabra TaxID=79078 RepID=A0ABU6WQS7_9FABA|nr:hypothetical protein [Stylosanthes scabra]
MRLTLLLHPNFNRRPQLTTPHLSSSNSVSIILSLRSFNIFPKLAFIPLVLTSPLSCLSCCPASSLCLPPTTSPASRSRRTCPSRSVLARTITVLGVVLALIFSCSALCHIKIQELGKW